MRAGGRLQIGAEVLRGEPALSAAEAGADGKLVAVYSAAAAREQEHRAGTWLLATGGIAGGGVRTDFTGAVWETALGLPLQAPATRGEWFAPRFLNEAGHPIYGAGVATDQQLRPLDAAGGVLYTNVAVAGSALAGCDPIRERCYSGMALATGWCAGNVLSAH